MAERKKTQAAFGIRWKAAWRRWEHGAPRALGRGKLAKAGCVAPWFVDGVSILGLWRSFICEACIFHFDSTCVVERGLWRSCAWSWSSVKRLLRRAVLLCVSGGAWHGRAGLAAWSVEFSVEPGHGEGEIAEKATLSHSHILREVWSLLGVERSRVANPFVELRIFGIWSVSCKLAPLELGALMQFFGE